MADTHRLYGVLVEMECETLLVEGTDLSFRAAEQCRDRMRARAMRAAIVELRFCEGSQDLFEDMQMRTHFRETVVRPGEQGGDLPF